MNGGGQLRSEEKDKQKELLSLVNTVYKEINTSLPEENSLIDKLYTDWLGGRDSDKSRKLLHTQYHEIEKETSALAMKW